ncbi:MAG: hypothetical protein CUN53_06210 [Phototrophicales bacterium]|nr:MAG: hypothetical protein CUN53_06210 [Phototrophicales bacterium]
MNDKELLDIYTDYLISSFGSTTQTGLLRLLNGEISHDRIQRFLSKEPKTGKDLWLMVKPYVRQIQPYDGVIIVDDSIAQKPYTDENDMIAWHYDHTKGYSFKGINFITALYHVGDVSLPVNYHLIHKTEVSIDKKTQKEKRRSAVTRNEVYRDLAAADQTQPHPISLCAE